MSLRVVEPGLYTLIVDHGRTGYRSLGVPVGGAADRTSLVLGNALVGNPPDAAALEISLAGPTLQADTALACVLSGAPFTLLGDRHPEPLLANKTFTLLPGEQLRIGSSAVGMRAYLCVRGGVQEKCLLGSRSAREPLHGGQELTCGSGTIPRRFIHAPPTWTGTLQTLRVLDGAQADWFVHDDFCSGEYTVTPASNRMGLRLEGKPLRCRDGSAPTAETRELVSEAVCPGAVQVTRDGQCIILGVDGQTIGGYPKIAHVISADLDRLGQLRPGQRVRFVPTTMEEAGLLYRRQQADLHNWVIRLLGNEPLASDGCTHKT